MQGRSRTVRQATVWVVAVALLAACTGSSDQEEAKSPPASATPPSAELARFYDQEVTWSPCEPGFECTTYEVPLDYARPDGPTIRIAANRAKATSAKDRVGVLLLNPGGPGQSGLAYARSAKSGALGKQLTERFDLVGFDPRGVGKSAPIDCLTDAELDAFNAMDGTPDNPAEEQALVTSAERFAQGCLTRSKELTAHVGSREAVKDMDILRGILDEDTISYYGASYGTFLGALYADEFPGRVGRFVLDGAVDPSARDTDVSRVQAGGFETALNSFVDDCLSRTDCPLPKTKPQALSRIRDVMRQAELEPYPTEKGREVTESLALLGIVTGMYEPKQGWPFLRDSLKQVIDLGQADGLLALADVYTERGENGYKTNAMEALSAISCLDNRSDASVASVKASVNDFVKVSPTFGRALAWSALGCSQWKVPAQGQPAKIAAKGAPPILVVGTTRDPATPLVWAKALADQLESGVLLTRDGDGHVGYQQGNGCIDSAVETYLTGGAVPADGTRCAAGS